MDLTRVNDFYRSVVGELFFIAEHKCMYVFLRAVL